LEKKRKREAEIEVFNTAKSLADEVNADRNGPSRSNQAYSSFRRQLSLSERRQDPQKAIMVDPIPIQRLSSTVEGNLLNLDDVGSPPSRPNSSSSFDRQQSSFHVPSNDQSGPLRRFHSLRTDIQNKIVSHFRTCLKFIQSCRHAAIFTLCIMSRFMKVMMKRGPDVMANLTTLHFRLEQYMILIQQGVKTIRTRRMELWRMVWILMAKVLP
jgi:hypothetical protein